MSAHEELARQLADSVAARRRPRRTLAALGLARWWREIGGGAVALAACAVLLALVVLPAAPRETAPARPQAELADLLAASSGEGACAPCQSVGGRLHAPLSAGAAEPGSPEAREVVVRRGLPAVFWSSQGG